MSGSMLRDAAQDNYSKNKTWSKRSGSYQTKLSTKEEVRFLRWVKENKVPFDPSEKADYDMRGFWKAMNAGDTRATTAVNNNDHQIHFPDVWKTPYHQSFSVESMWATPDAPRWNEKDQLVAPDGRVIFDERAETRTQKRARR